MKLIRLLFALLLITNCSFAQKQEKYARAKVFLDTKHSIRDLSALGVATDHGEYKKNTFFITDFSPAELKAMRKAGFKVQILIKDVSKYYREQNKGRKGAQKTTTTTDCNMGPTLDVPAHFQLGSYGGYFTYAEMLAQLDSMHTVYPGLISARAAVDTYHSIEGRPIYWLRVSNNPSISQPTKPQMIYTALHHAREPGSISSTIYYLWYLLEHYNTDQHIKAIIDNTELYFIPCVNPDGYLYNISTNPTGGGLWRKNRRVNGDGTMGVDLNRNYGFNWAYDNIGSSPVTSSETYRGTAGFSEPETQAVKWFDEHHHFQISLNYHTYGNDVIYPWGYIGSLLTSDSSQFVADGGFITQYTPYRYGTGDQTVGYVTNGDSDDWGYGEQTTKNKILSMTPETGLTEFGFYTPISNIIPDCINNLRTNINAATLLLPFAQINSDDEKIITHTTGHLHYDLQRLGYPDTAVYTVAMTSLDSRLTITGAPQVYNNLTILQKVSDSFAYTLASGTPNGQLIHYELSVYNGYYYTRDTLSFYYGKYSKNVVPNTNTLTEWTTGGWGVCNSTYYSAPASLVSNDVNCGNYHDNSNLELDLNDTLDLTHSLRAYLYFYCRWGIESTYDYLVAEASQAGASNWQPLCGRFTKPGSTSQLHGEPIYDGQHPDWVQEEFDLSAYLGQKINIRFTLVSDGAVNYSGFYIDNMNAITVEDSAHAVGITSYSAATATPILKAYPDPAHDKLNISVSGYDFSHLLHAGLYDCFGRKVMNVLLYNSLVTVDIQSLTPGIYYLKVEDGNIQLPVTKIEIRK